MVLGVETDEFCIKTVQTSSVS